MLPAITRAASGSEQQTPMYRPRLPPPNTKGPKALQARFLQDSGPFGAYAE